MLGSFWICVFTYLTHALINWTWAVNYEHLSRSLIAFILIFIFGYLLASTTHDPNKDKW